MLDLFGACHVDQPRFFVCDSAKNKTLQGYLRNNRDRSIRLTKLHEAALGMLYLHMREIVHGDLTTEKIMEKPRSVVLSLTSRVKANQRT